MQLRRIACVLWVRGVACRSNRFCAQLWPDALDALDLIRVQCDEVIAIEGDAPGLAALDELGCSGAFFVAECEGREVARLAVVVLLAYLAP